jgi:hypothetical protein
MPTLEARDWSGDDWEDLVHTLLTLRHGVGNYQRVPSTHGGDCGLESFSTDGNAYQCYAAQEYTSVETLYEKQRDKMSTDVRKFIHNRARLIPLLGTLRVKRWLLVVPVHKSAKLVAHASTKTTEVLSANLPYVDTDFRVGILDFADLRAEYRHLIEGGGPHLSFAPVEIDNTTIEAFAAASQNSDLLRNLAEKLGRVPMLSQDERRKAGVIQELTQGYLRGQAYLDQLHENYPELHRRFVVFKRRKERELALLSLVSTQQADGRLEAHIKELGERIQSEIPTVIPMVDALVAESIADWIMRCPLDFYSTA